MVFTQYHVGNYYTNVIKGQPILTIVGQQWPGIVGARMSQLPGNALVQERGKTQQITWAYIRT
jgi:hypothetical protein